MTRHQKKAKMFVMVKLLDSLEKYLLYIVLFATPLLVLPVFANPYETPKLIFLGFGVLAILALKTIKAFFRGAIEISLGSFDWPIALLTISVILSAILRTPNKVDAFFVPGTATFILSGVLIYFLINQLTVSEKKSAGAVLFLSGLAYSLIYLLSTIGFFAKIPQLPAFIKAASFTTMGGALPGVVFLAALIPIALSLVLAEKGLVQKFFLIISGLVLVFALILSTITILPGKPTAPLSPSFNTSWSVFVETVKQSPILGVGPGNFVSAFNLYRPLSYNSTNTWAIRFTSAKDFYLTFMAETGLLGLAALAIIAFSLVKLLQTGFLQKESTKKFFESSGALVSLIILLILLLLFPAISAIYMLLFALFGLSAQVHKVKLNISGADSSSQLASRLPALFVTLPILAGAVFVAFLGYKAVYAEMTFKNSLDALNANDGKTTYELMRKAITINPYVDRYHSSFSQINMALANSIAQKKDITDTDRSTITQLIQQAISEGKAAVTLNPSRADNWEILARTYQAIMPFATGADAFAVQTYTQTVALDPINPNLRIALGGVYYALGRYDDAISVFQLATFAKPDLANSHYNLAIAYRDKGETQKAIDEMNAVLSLVVKDSEDYKLAQTELDNLKKKLPTTTESTTNLTTPQKAGTSNVKPPITLPKEATPPATP